MKRLFLSDLHIGDGYATDDFSYDAELVRLLDNVLASGENVELVILGDGLELIETRVVRDIGLIPFDDLIAQLDGKIVQNIVDVHPDVFRAFQRFSRKNPILYIVGNHDYYMWPNQKVQEAVCEAFGGNSQIRVQPYFYDERWGVFGIHGNNFDTGNRFVKDKEGNLIPPMGEFMSRYMMVYFEEVLLHTDVPESIVKDYDDIRPGIEMFEWFEYVVKTYNLSINLLELWTTEMLKMLRTAYAKHWMKACFPRAHHLSHLFLNRFGGVVLGKAMVKGVSKLRSIKVTDYMKNRARKILLCGSSEPKCRFRESDFYGFCPMPTIDYEHLRGLIFGHRHRQDTLILPHDGQHKFYVNTGTWRTVVEKALRKDLKRFVKRSELSYIRIQEEEQELHIETVMVNRINHSSTSRQLLPFESEKVS